jgi:hypothetical protein
MSTIMVKGHPCPITGEISRKFQVTEICWKTLVPEGEDPKPYKAIIFPSPDRLVRTNLVRVAKILRRSCNSVIT